MAKLIFFVLLFASAFLYRWISRKRLTYLGIPDAMISEKKKYRIFCVHAIVSLIASVFLVQLTQEYIILVTEDESLNFITLLLIFYVVLLFIVGYGIDLFLRSSNPQIAFVTAISKNAGLISEAEELKTASLMAQDEFWLLLNKEDKPMSPEQYKSRLQQVSLELAKYHPVKQVEFYNRLLELRNSFFSKDLCQIYWYVWGRKYEDDHFLNFSEFIIAQGKTELEKIKLDLNGIASLDLNLVKLNRFSITSVFMHLYLANTQKIFPVPEDIEATQAMDSFQSNMAIIKERFPSVFQKFK
jgi:hypothetical protein